MECSRVEAVAEENFEQSTPFCILDAQSCMAPGSVQGIEEACSALPDRAVDGRDLCWEEDAVTGRDSGEVGLPCWRKAKHQLLLVLDTSMSQKSMCGHKGAERPCTEH